MRTVFVITKPNPIIRGYYFVTRRTLGGRLRMQPSPKMKKLIEFLLAVGAVRYGVHIVAFKALSNHWHAVLFDQHGNHRAFVQFVNSLLARTLNVMHDTDDSVFSGRRNPPVLIADAETLVRKIVYVIGNSVSSGLTEQARSIPPQSRVDSPRHKLQQIPALQTLTQNRNTQLASPSFVDYGVDVPD